MARCSISSICFWSCYDYGEVSSPWGVPQILIHLMFRFSIKSIVHGDPLWKPLRTTMKLPYIFLDSISIGGLEHFSFIFPSFLGIILPTDGRKNTHQVSHAIFFPMAFPGIPPEVKPEDLGPGYHFHLQDQLRHKVRTPCGHLASNTGWWLGCHFLNFPINIGNVIIPIDELHHFSEGWVYNHQPE